MQLHEKNSVKPTETQYLFTSTSIKTTDGLLIKAMYLKGFVLRFVLPFYCNVKSWKVCGNFWEFWVFSRWPNVSIQALHIQNPSCFRCFNIIQMSTPWPAFFSIAQTSWSQANINVQSFLKFPTWGGQKVQSSHLIPCPPLPSGIRLTGALRQKNLTFFSWWSFSNILVMLPCPGVVT